MLKCANVSSKIDGTGVSCKKEEEVVETVHYLFADLLLDSMTMVFYLAYIRCRCLLKKTDFLDQTFIGYSIDITKNIACTPMYSILLSNWNGQN